MKPGAKNLDEIASRVMMLKDKSLGRGNASHSAIFSSEEVFDYGKN